MRAAVVVACAALYAVTAGAQAQDHSKHQEKPKEAMKHDMGKMDHMAGPWKEMNAFHTQLAATF
ncbi:MAG: hypothetical protein JNL26_03145, partial [Gemmatimonadetes bacterium]|nr:hypothetical protein [Gemmatimonadota bacterium]